MGQQGLVKVQGLVVVKVQVHVVVPMFAGVWGPGGLNTDLDGGQPAGQFGLDRRAN